MQIQHAAHANAPARPHSAISRRGRTRLKAAEAARAVFTCPQGKVPVLFTASTSETLSAPWPDGKRAAAAPGDEGFGPQPI